MRRMTTLMKLTLAVLLFPLFYVYLLGAWRGRHPAAVFLHALDEIDNGIRDVAGLPEKDRSIQLARFSRWMTYGRTIRSVTGIHTRQARFISDHLSYFWEHRVDPRRRYVTLTHDSDFGVKTLTLYPDRWTADNRAQDIRASGVYDADFERDVMSSLGIILRQGDE